MASKFNFLVSISLVVVFTLVSVTSGEGQGHDQNCNATVTCDTAKGLICSTGKCICRTQTVYNASADACQILVGGVCTYDPADIRCVPHAECGWNDQRCRCSYLYSGTSDGRCMSTLYGTCSTDADCNPHDLLKCHYGKCYCPQPLNQVFDYDNVMCAKRVAANCSLAEEANPANVRCKAGTSCRLSADGVSNTCQCAAGTLHNHYLDACRKGHMQFCNVTSGELCQWDAGLDCFQNRCQCTHDPDHVWDQAEERCAGVRGTRCTMTPVAYQELLACRTGLVCTGSPETGLFFGVCLEPKEDTDQDPTTPVPTTQQPPTTTTPPPNNNGVEATFSNKVASLWIGLGLLAVAISGGGGGM